MQEGVAAYVLVDPLQGENCLVYKHHDSTFNQ